MRRADLSARGIGLFLERCLKCAFSGGIPGGTDGKRKKEENKMACCCGEDENGRKKHKPRTPEQVKSLVTRLNRIDGQILGIKKMIEENRYCPDVLMQVSAVQASLNSFNKELLSTHIKTCVVDDIRDGKEEAVDELCELLKKTMK